LATGVEHKMRTIVSLIIGKEPVLY